MITLMAMLAKEAVDNIRDKEKKHLEKIFKKIENEIQKDDVLKSILSLNKVDNLEKLFLFINNQNLKKEIQQELDKLGINFEEIRISILNSAKEFNKKLEDVGIENIIYFSMAAFRNGEKISGKIIKAMLVEDTKKLEKEKNNIGKNFDIYEVDGKNKQLKKISEEEIKRTEQEIKKKKIMDEVQRTEKNPEMGMPTRGNPGVSGPGL